MRKTDLTFLMNYFGLELGAGHDLDAVAQRVRHAARGYIGPFQMPAGGKSLSEVLVTFLDDGSLRVSPTPA
jgi:hypothetical protein